MKNKIKLLIIDDAYSTRKVLEHFLNKEFEVALKNDGVEGLSWLEVINRGDLIIADLDMPNLNGKQFLEVVRDSSFFNDLPIIIISGTDESKERIECLNLGGDDFMIKPFNPMKVHAKVKAILRRTKQ